MHFSTESATVTPSSMARRTSPSVMVPITRPSGDSTIWNRFGVARPMRASASLIVAPCPQVTGSKRSIRCIGWILGGRHLAQCEEIGALAPEMTNHFLQHRLHLGQIHDVVGLSGIAAAIEQLNGSKLVTRQRRDHAVM